MSHELTVGKPKMKIKVKKTIKMKNHWVFNFTTVTSAEFLSTIYAKIKQKASNSYKNLTCTLVK